MVVGWGGGHSVGEGIWGRMLEGVPMDKRLGLGNGGYTKGVQERVGVIMFSGKCGQNCAIIRDRDQDWL